MGVILYYLITQGMTLLDSIKYLTSKRNQYTRSNIGFFRQLLTAEKELCGKNSISITDFINNKL